MSNEVIPRCKASISPDFVTLIKQARLPATQTSNNSKAECQSNPVDDKKSDLPPPKTQPEWMQVALRRDGERPVHAEAMLAWESEDKPIVTFAGSPVVINRRLSVYIQRNQNLLVHLCQNPPDGYPARAIHRVFQPRTAQDLSENIRNNGPELCFKVSAQTASYKEADLPAPFVSAVSM